MNYHSDSDINSYEISSLMQKVRKSTYGGKLLTPEQEADLARRLKANPEDMDAIEQLVLGNLGLIIQMANRYRGQSRNSTTGDLVAVGVTGIMRAIARYNPIRVEADGKKVHAKFSTYASWWIKQSIARYLLVNRNVYRISEHMAGLRLNLRRAIQQLQETQEESPSVEQLAEIMRVKPSEVRRIIAAGETALSIDEVVGGANHDNKPGGLSLGETLVDLSQAHPLKKLAVSEDMELLYSSFNALSDRNAIILIYRKGLVDAPISTLEEIGKIVGVTRERVRQCEAQATEALRKAIDFRISVMVPPPGSAAKGLERCRRLVKKIEAQKRALARVQSQTSFIGARI